MTAKLVKQSLKAVRLLILPLNLRYYYSWEHSLIFALISL